MQKLENTYAMWWFYNVEKRIVPWNYEISLLTVTVKLSNFYIIYYWGVKGCDEYACSLYLFEFPGCLDSAISDISGYATRVSGQNFQLFLVFLDKFYGFLGQNIVIFLVFLFFEDI